jgi:hypothetical protein
MKMYLLLIIGVLLLIASPVSSKEGLYIGAAFIPHNSLNGDAGSGVDSGTGWGLRAGVGANRYFAIEANYIETKNDMGLSSVYLKGLSGDVKVNFPLTSLDRAQVMTVEPYLKGGYAYYKINKPTSAKSGGLQWGFGVELYLFRELSIDAGWTQTNISWDTSPKADGRMRTVDIGIMYHFF